MPTLANGTTEVIPRRNYNEGTFATPSTWTLQTGQSKLTMMADRNSWPDTGADVVKVQFDISYDGGTTRQLLGSFTARGGDITNPWTGAVETQSSFSLALPQPDNPNRSLFGAATIYTRINTAVSLTVE